MRIFKWASLTLFLLLAAGLSYGLHGYLSALGDAEILSARADELIAGHKGPSDLGEARLNYLLMVEDPNFYQHSGVDISTKGAGITTLSQSLSKRVGFESFKPGIAKIRQTGYAIGLENTLTKTQILALFLDTAEMGNGPNGWMKGFFTAAQDIYGHDVRDINNHEFLTLVAVLIAPGSLKLAEPDKALHSRVERIEKLIAKKCHPINNSDVWLEGCA